MLIIKAKKIHVSGADPLWHIQEPNRKEPVAICGTVRATRDFMSEEYASHPLCRGCIQRGYARKIITIIPGV